MILIRTTRTKKVPLATRLVNRYVDGVPFQCQVDFGAVVSPRAELHRALLIVERKPLNVDSTRRDEESDWNPRHFPSAVDDCVRRKLAVDVLIRAVPQTSTSQRVSNDFDCLIHPTSTWNGARTDAPVRTIYTQSEMYLRGMRDQPPNVLPKFFQHHFGMCVQDWPKIHHLQCRPNFEKCNFPKYNFSKYNFPKCCCTSCKRVSPAPTPTKKPPPKFSSATAPSSSLEDTYSVRILSFERYVRMLTCCILA